MTKKIKKEQVSISFHFAERKNGDDDNLIKIITKAFIDFEAPSQCVYSEGIADAILKERENHDN